MEKTEGEILLGTTFPNLLQQNSYTEDNKSGTRGDGEDHPKHLSETRVLFY